MDRAVDGFLRYLKFERNASPLTLKSYSEDLDSLGVYFQDRLGTVPEPAQVTVGILRGYVAYWGAGLNYDWHSHQAEELYLTLAGGAVFRVDGNEAFVGSNETRHHESWQSHAMTTTEQPILTFVLWRGDGMGDLPRMDAA